MKELVRKEPIVPFTDRVHELFRAKGVSTILVIGGSERLLVSDMGFICIGDERIDTRGLHDIITEGQLDALSYLLRYLEISNRDQIIDLRQRIDDMYDRIAEEGLDCVFSGYFTATGRFLDLPRKQELMALISRMRRIHFVRH